MRQNKPSEEEEALAFLEDFELLDDGLALIGETDDVIEVPVVEQEPLQWPVATAADDNARDSTETLEDKSDAASKKKKPRSKKVSANSNRARNVRREELVYLRGKVGDLESQLEELKKDDSEGERRPCSRVTRVMAARPSEQRETQFSVWAEIASRQYAERQQAELKNIRLKMLLESQIKVGKGLEKLLNNRSNTQILQLCDEDVPRSDPNRVPQQLLHENEADIFQALLMDLERAVLRVNDVFEANGLSTNETPFQDASILSNCSNGIHLEVIGNKIMPFDIHATSNAVWKHLSSRMDQMPFRFYFKRQRKFMEATDDTIVESFDTELHSKHGVGYLRARKVLRRYVEDDRVLIAWRETIDPIEYGSQPTPAIRFMEQGYTVIKQPTTAPPNYSLVQTCFHMWPDGSNQQHPQYATMVGQLSNFFLDTLARSMYFSNQMVENCLLDQSISQQLAVQLVGFADMSDGVETEEALLLLDGFESLGGEDFDIDELMMHMDAQAQALMPHDEPEPESSALVVGTQPVTSASASNGNPKRPAKRTRKREFNPNRARDERKEEILYLRKRVREMEDTLEQLKSGGMRRAIVASSTAFKHSPLRLDTSLTLTRGRMQTAGLISSPWEDVAVHQYAERQRAEMENVRLKMMLEDQIKVAKGLEKLLNRKSNAQIMELYGNPMAGAMQPYDSSSQENEAEIFEHLLLELDKAVLSVDAVFEANGLNSTQRPFQDTRVRKNDRHEIVLELFANKVLPFGIHATSAAVWKHLSVLFERMPLRSYYERQPKNACVQKMEVTDDTIVESFHVFQHATRTTARFLIRQVLRRYIEEDRIVIAWRQTVDPVEFSSQPTSGIRFSEQGYMVIKRPVSSSLDHSLMQTCFIMTPQHYDRNSDHEHKVGQISNFFLDSIAQNIYESQKMIQNVLMDESLQASLKIS